MSMPADPPLQTSAPVDRPSPRINPFHLLSHPDSSHPLPDLPPHLQALAMQPDTDPDAESRSPPVHITKVSGAEVTLRSHPEATNHKTFLGRVSGAFKRDSAESDSRFGTSPIVMQGAPPSPPPSDGGMDDSVVMSDEDLPATLSSNGNHSQTGDARPVLATSFTSEPSDFDPLVVLAPPIPAARRVSGSSTTSSRAGSLTLVRSGRLAPQRDGENLAKTKDLPALPNGSDVELERRDSAGNLLSPTPMLHRRSTVGSPIPPPPPAPRSPLMHSRSTFASPSSTPPPAQGKNGFLDSAIQEQEETIRRERFSRLERRSKKASATSDGEHEPKPEDISSQHYSPKQQAPPPRQPLDKEKEEARVLVGNLIGEDHVNYVLMYNMLTGIRIGVSRCQAKIGRVLTDDDYTARHKFSFDIIGNELTPSAKYDFKFKDYAPWVFRELREQHFNLDPADYLLSLTAKYILSELGSPGKSGSFFYFSRDYRFIIKTISHHEHKFLRSILKDYHEHVKENPHTLLSRFYGLHRVKLPRGPKIHFVIMNNLFPPHRDIHETYDLKGSAFGREYPEDKAVQNPRATLKDKNWVNRGRLLELGPEKRALLTSQLKRDMEFLRKIRVMDYSLLVGIHNMERGNRDNLRNTQLSVFHPEVTTTKRKPSTHKGGHEASNIRKVVRRADPKTLDVTSQLPSEDAPDHANLIFYQNEGGFQATDERNNPLDTIYYLGVIDICTPYNTAKKVEHCWKSMTEDRHMISCVDPVQYGQRFFDFLRSVMRKGDLSLRPPGLEPIAKVDKPDVGQDTDRDPCAGIDTTANASGGPDQGGGSEGLSSAEVRRDAPGIALRADGAEATEPAMVGHLKAD
ncbi:hypothetical protein L202_07422 [Cryptococcus amylolentus CBS 6039]|uniref:1-phosphatidylinositol-4-phosphate 5-kinase n=1 Tax=Cryptococcus amylolentus CBS 6039 TaxID=1295533 RepID=A0A1E3HCR8_9TREE|nr:hypothetical protein L202_07422 [Cryptococcus amylolentus CBS 6039]ODN73915.1 hypothetical protein L202_07422 [Cryptococcus amylolentus CBS 6039]